MFKYKVLKPVQSQRKTISPGGFIETEKEERELVEMGFLELAKEKIKSDDEDEKPKKGGGK